MTVPLITICAFKDKREYNSERRRKLVYFINKFYIRSHIRENITPRGDGNKEAQVIANWAKAK